MPVKLKLSCAQRIKLYAMKAYGGVDVSIHIFFTSALLEVSGQLHARPLYPRGKGPGTHSIGGWVDPRAGQDDMEKRKFFTLPGLALGPLSRQPVVSHYADYATPARNKCQYCVLI
jgi:hypothetical protein